MFVSSDTHKIMDAIGMTSLDPSAATFIERADHIINWSDDLLQAAPLTTDQREDLEQVQQAAQHFRQETHTKYATTMQAGDPQAVQRLRHQLRNRLNIVVGFTGVWLQRLPDNLLLHLLTVRKIHETGMTLLDEVNQMHNEAP